MNLTRRLEASLVIGILLAACSGTASHTELRDELLEMGRIDQEAGKRALALMQDLPNSTEEFISAVEEQDKVYAENFSKLEMIIAEHGGPGGNLSVSKPAEPH